MAATWLSPAQAQAKGKEKATSTASAKAGSSAPAKKAPPKATTKAAAKADPKTKAPAKGARTASGKSLEADHALAGEKIGGGKKENAKASQGKGSKSRPQRTASTQPAGKSKPAAKGKKRKPEPPCMRPAIEVNRGFARTEIESVTLTYCDGKPAPQAAEYLSILARPTGAKRPKMLPNTPPPSKPSRKTKGKGTKSKAPQEEPLPNGELAPGVKLVDEGLVTRLQKVVDRFQAKRVFIISGYRPQSDRSFHQKAKALDFRIEGIKNEELVAFCRTLPDTGCGYYPNSSFVHMDVRPPKTGHIYWIDASGPGESPRYVSSWPPKEKPEPGDDAVLDPGEVAGESDVDISEGFAMRKPSKSSEAADEGAPSLMKAFGADLANEKEAAPSSSPIDIEEP